MTNHPIEPHPVLVRVAKAIAARHIQFGAEDAVGKVMLEHSWRNHLDDARAALEALRDLPEDVIAAGERAAWDDHNHMPAIRAMPRAIAAMINHITGEPDA